ncbi:MAG: RES family NAD+ phosphorylase [Arenicellales bacterium]
MLDSKILDALDNLTGESLKTHVWRVTWSTRDPLTGGVGGGRWSPPNLFEALYTSFEKDGALSEAYYHLSRAPVFSSSTMNVNKISVDLNNVLTLDEKVLNDLGVEDPTASRIDFSATQPISETAHLLDFEGIIVPSARYEGINLVIFMDRVNLDTQLEIVETIDVNWPAWREKRG